MCSSTRGPAIAPSLVTCPTRSVVTPRSLATRISRAVHARTWPTLPGRAGELRVEGGLDRVDDEHAGLALAHRGLDRRDVEFGEQGDALRHGAEPPGAQPDLLRRLLAAHVEHVGARLRRAHRRPAAAVSTCRFPARRRAGRATRRQARRRAPGRARRSRSRAATASAAPAASTPSGTALARAARRLVAHGLLDLFDDTFRTRRSRCSDPSSERRCAPQFWHRQTVRALAAIRLLARGRRRRPCLREREPTPRSGIDGLDGRLVRGYGQPRWYRHGALALAEGRLAVLDERPRSRRPAASCRRGSARRAGPRGGAGSRGAADARPSVESKPSCGQQLAGLAR